jgi:hypothetical protein
MMHNEQIIQLRNFAAWIRINLKKAACLEVNYWNHPVNNKETVEYLFWVEGLFHESSSSLHDLVDMIPHYKQLLCSNKEVEA